MTALLERPRMPAGRTVSAIAAIGWRDVIKLLRDRPRLAVNLAFPILLVVGLGNVLRATVGPATGLDAVPLAFSGVLAATLFQSTAAGMISIVEDRETDFARELFVAPVARWALVAGKIAGESLVALAQGVCVVAVALLIGVRLDAAQVGRLLPVALACCLLGGAFGLTTIAVLPNQRSAMQVFQFLIIPQYVLAGVLVPVRNLPGYLDWIARVMPLRYAVDLARDAYYAGTPGRAAAVIGDPVVDAVVVGVLFVILIVAGASLFDYRERKR
ncbi:MAG TPA: ABC transporter permease [Micromonosporaceae bacterium]